MKKEKIFKDKKEIAKKVFFDLLSILILNYIINALYFNKNLRNKIKKDKKLRKEIAIECIEICKETIKLVNEEINKNKIEFNEDFLQMVDSFFKFPL